MNEKTNIIILFPIVLGVKKQLACQGLYSLLLVEMADQRGFDLQLEFMLLIIWVCFVVLQT